MRFLSLCFPLLGACAALAPDKKLEPALAPVRETPAASNASLRIWAGTKLPRLSPSDVESWVAPIALDIENTGATSVELTLEDFRLVDDKGRKAAPFFVPVVVSYPLDVERLREDVRKNPPSQQGLEKSSYVFVAGVQRGPALGGAQWLDDVGRPNAPPHDWVEQVRFIGAPRGLALWAFTDRRIDPGERVTGFLFFPRPERDAESVSLVWVPQGEQKRALSVPFALR